MESCSERGVIDDHDQENETTSSGINMFFCIWFMSMQNYFETYFGRDRLPLSGDVPFYIIGNFRSEYDYDYEYEFSVLSTRTLKNVDLET